MPIIAAHPMIIPLAQLRDSNYTRWAQYLRFISALLSKKRWLIVILQSGILSHRNGIKA